MFYNLFSSILYSIGFLLLFDRPAINKTLSTTINMTKKSYDYVYRITKYFRKSPIGYDDL